MIYFVTPYIYAQTKRYTAVEKKRVLFVATYFLEEELLSVLMSIVWILSCLFKKSRYFKIQIAIKTANSGGFLLRYEGRTSTGSF